MGDRVEGETDSFVLVCKGVEDDENDEEEEEVVLVTGRLLKTISFLWDYKKKRERGFNIH